MISIDLNCIFKRIGGKWFGFFILQGFRGKSNILFYESQKLFKQALRRCPVKHIQKHWYKKYCYSSIFLAQK